MCIDAIAALATGNRQPATTLHSYLHLQCRIICIISESTLNLWNDNGIWCVFFKKINNNGHLPFAKKIYTLQSIQHSRSLHNLYVHGE